MRKNTRRAPWKRAAVSALVAVLVMAATGIGLVGRLALGTGLVKEARAEGGTLTIRYHEGDQDDTSTLTFPLANFGAEGDTRTLSVEPVSEMATTPSAETVTVDGEAYEPESDLPGGVLVVPTTAKDVTLDITLPEAGSAETTSTTSGLTRLLSSPRRVANKNAVPIVGDDYRITSHYRTNGITDMQFYGSNYGVSYCCKWNDTRHPSPTDVFKVYDPDDPAVHTGTSGDLKDGTLGTGWWHRWTRCLDYVIACGFNDQNTTINVSNGQTVTGEKAREITQLAVWHTVNMDFSNQHPAIGSWWYKNVLKPYLDDAWAYAMNTSDTRFDDCVVYCVSDTCQNQVFLGRVQKNGWAKVKKLSANTAITNGNKCYDLTGTTYMVADSNGNDTGKTLVVKNNNGDCDPIELPVGTYWVHETKAGKGYILDTTSGDHTGSWSTKDYAKKYGWTADTYGWHKVTVTAGQTTTLELKDQPGDDPILTVLKKENAATNTPVAGAEYTIRYYDNYDGKISGTPKYTWVIKTNDKGLAVLSSRISGDQLIKDGNDPVIPLGTISVQETKSPSGYYLETLAQAKKYDTHSKIVDAGSGKAPYHVQVATLDSAAKAVKGWVTPTVVDSPIPPELGTTLTATSTNAHVAVPATDVTLTDKVAYKNLTVGKSYTLTGTLHVRKPDGTDGGALKDKDGKTVTATTTFKATATSGTATVTFSHVDMSSLASSTVVAFETLKVDGATAATHVVITDEGQSVHFPSISTTLTSDATSSHMAPAATGVALTDRVAYRNLLAGKTYRLTCTLHVRNADGSDGGTLRGADGKVVTANLDFKPGKADGTADVKLTGIDTTKVAGRSLVAFETLTLGGKTVATHSSISDEGQTVRVPKVGTTLAAPDGTLCGTAVKLVDTVSYENLVAGTEYTLTGTLHARGADGRDAGAIKDASGKEVTATAKFTPNASSGTQDVAFTVDTTALAGKTIVCFERLAVGGTVVASHEDITDEGQSLTFPKVETELLGPTGTHQVGALAGQHLTDTVTYSGLEDGATYELRAYLVRGDEAKEGADEAALSPVATGTATFSAKGADGTADVDIRLDAQTLGDRDVVCYEYLYRDGQLVARHASATDARQTVHVTLDLPLTGEGGNPLLPLAPAALAVGATATLMATRRHARKDGTGGKRA